jgi:hypothetical protein
LPPLLDLDHLSRVKKLLEIDYDEGVPLVFNYRKTAGNDLPTSGRVCTQNRDEESSGMTMSLRVADHPKKIWLLGCLTLIIVLATMVSGSKRSGTDWDCAPIDPTQQTPHTNPCFRVTLSNGHRLTLEWRVGATAQSVYIYDDTAPNYADIGSVPGDCNTGPSGGCAVSLAVVSAGNYRWILGVTGRDGENIHISREISVLPPPDRIEITGGGLVDPFLPASHEFSWHVDIGESNSLAAVTDRWVELQRPTAFGWSSSRYPASGPDARFTIPSTEFDHPGNIVFRLRACHFPPGSTVKFCSPAHSVAYNVQYDKFTGSRHLHASSGRDLDIAFSNQAGNFRMLSSTTLLPNTEGVAVSGVNYTIDGTMLTPGIHQLELNSCLLQENRCSNRTPADPAPTAGMLYQLPAGHYTAGDLIAVIVPGGASPVQKIHAPVTGEVFFENESPISPISPGDPIAYSIGASSDVMTVLVDAPERWRLARNYREDFETGTGYNLTGFGEPLDTVFDDNNGIWTVNEFSNNLEHVDPTGQVHSLNVPMARTTISPKADENPLEPLALINRAVRPFAFWGPEMLVGRTSVSSLVERIANIDSRIWLSQGGGFQTQPQTLLNNHSRIIAYDPARDDSAHTRYDDRFCVFNVPTDDAFGLGNNQVIGLAAARGRIWIAESRGLFSEESSLVSSFFPSQDQCENLLDFESPEALPAQELQYCGPQRNPEQDRCMDRLVLDELPRNIKVAHLQVDPVDETLWFTDASGQVLGHIDPDRESVTSLHHFEDTHDKLAHGAPGMGGFPWSLVVDREAVYIGEYSTRHILRFDKSTSTYHEMHVPFNSNEQKLHSLALDSLRDRLWFTLANEQEVPSAGANSTIGYIDLASWRAHLASPAQGLGVEGTVYSGLDDIPGSPLHPGMPQGFRGIAFDTATGSLAIATMFRHQVTVLTPRPGFWP